jgi:hypothetical protein
MKQYHRFSLVSIILCLWVGSLSAQATGPRLRMGAYFSAEWTHSPRYIIGLRNQQDFGGVGGELWTAIPLGKQFSLQTGLGYCWRPKTFTYTYINNAGFSGVATSKFNLGQVSLPLRLRYHFGTFEAGPYISVGPEVQYLFRQSGTSVLTTSQGSNEHEFGFFRLSTTVAATGSIGWQFPISSRVSLCAEPFFKLVPRFSYRMFVGRWHSVGMHLGVAF